MITIPPPSCEKLLPSETDLLVTVVSVCAVLGPSGAGIAGVLMELTVLVQDAVVILLLEGVP